MRLTALIVALSAIATMSSPATACSPAPGYIPPTNFELVERADAIVVATAVEQLTRGSKFDLRWGFQSPDYYVLFKSEYALKGLPPTQFVARSILGEPRRKNEGGDIRFSFAKRDPEKVEQWTMLEPPPSNPDSLVGMNRGTGGACNRVIFARGASYIIFLKRDADTSWRELDDDLGTRINEDFLGPGSLWLKTIQSYVDIQKKPSAEWTRLLLSRVDALGREPASQWRDEQITDVMRQLWPRRCFMYGEVCP